MLSYENREEVALGMGKRMLHYGHYRTPEELIAAVDRLTAQELYEVAREVMMPEDLTTLIYR